MKEPNLIALTVNQTIHAQQLNDRFTYSVLKVLFVLGLAVKSEPSDAQHDKERFLLRRVILREVLLGLTSIRWW
jgi:hypothetical protein